MDGALLKSSIHKGFKQCMAKYLGIIKRFNLIVPGTAGEFEKKLKK
jgi:hypothetical protein